ncbi:Ger(x)C family spore germination protein, partial [Paenibacillus sepulcri]|nr:Ger(x)C family spore germination protein [Paenibacillus sepulcri]
GYTIDDALDNLQQQIADPRTLIHLRIVVISEAIARRGLRDLNDYFRRETQVRRTTWLLVSDVEAARLMDVAPPLERVPALYLLAMIEKSHQMGKFPTDYIGKFWSAESKLGQDGYLPYVSIRQKENILLKGMAYFNEDKMVGYTTPIQIGVYMGIMGLNPGGYSALFDVPGVGVVMVNTLKRSSRVKVKINDGIPHAEIDIQLEATMKEKIGEAGSFDSQAKLHEVERVFEQEVKKNAIQLIKETQLKKSDVFGFGEKIRAHERSFWNRNIKSEKDWENLYAKLTADVHVHVDLRRFGLVAQNKSE